MALLLQLKLFTTALWILCMFKNVHSDRMRAGYTYPLSIDSDNDELSQIQPEKDHADIGKNGKMWTLHYEGVTYIAVHFKYLHLQPGEFLNISDATGQQSYTIEEEGKPGSNGNFWARHVKGETMLIRLVSDYQNHTDHVFEIDEIALGDPNLNLEEDTPRQLRGSIVKEDYAGYHHSRRLDNCGLNDRRNAICYKDEYPVHYDTAKAVARLLIQGAFLCTGWLATDSSHLITNYHCIGGVDDALNTDFEFEAETPSCEESNGQLKTPGVVFSGGNFLLGDEGKDYAVVLVSGNPSSSYPYLELEMDVATIDSTEDEAFRDAVLGMEIYLPQHSAGFDKEFGIESTHPEDEALGSSTCHVVGSFLAGCTATSGYYEIGYFCDSLGGSSGSAVISSESHKVIALHHCGCTNCACFNIGVPINEVLSDICEEESLAPFWECEGVPTQGPTSDPNSCEGHCGGIAETCWCDELCVQFGDCCTDACSQCGYNCMGSNSSPTAQPTSSPTTMQPTAQPTISPTTNPPTTQPTISPTTNPPTAQPTSSPITTPPTSQSTSSPILSPTASPSASCVSPAQTCSRNSQCCSGQCRKVKGGGGAKACR